MLPRWPTSPAWTELLAAIAPALEPALDALDLRPESLPEVVAGAPSSLLTVDEGRIALDPLLLGPALHHPLDAGRSLGLDRWRRATGAVLEGTALVALGATDWWAIARAADAVDRAAPALGWLWPEAAGLLAESEAGLVAAPRRGAWLVRWLRAQGRESPDLNLEQWLAFGRWCRDPAHGPAAGAPVPLLRARAGSMDDSVQMAPWSHRLVAVEGGAAGTEVEVEGPADFVPRTPVPAGERRALLLGSLAGGAVRLVRRSVGPVGVWELRSGAAAGHFGAARGVELTLSEDGRAELVAADAFMGPVSGRVLEMAQKFGVSGVSNGRWRITDATTTPHPAGRMVLTGLSADKATVHARVLGGFKLPGGDLLGPVRQALAQLDGTEVHWERPQRDELHVRVELYGMEVTLIFGRADSPGGRSDS